MFETVDKKREYMCLINFFYWSVKQWFFISNSNQCNVTKYDFILCIAKEWNIIFSSYLNNLNINFRGKQIGSAEDIIYI